MKNVTSFWSWQKVYFYGLVCHYVRGEGETSLASRLVTLLYYYGYESYDWILELEASNKIKLSDITFSENLIKKHFKNISGTAFNPDVPLEDILDYLPGKKFSSFREVIDDKYAGYSMLDCIVSLHLEVVDVDSIIDQLEQYLQDFQENRLITKGGVPAYSYAYQKEQFTQAVQRQSKMYGNTVPIDSATLLSDGHAEGLRFFEVLFLAQEKEIAVLDVNWKPNKGQESPLQSAVIKILSAGDIDSIPNSEIVKFGKLHLIADEITMDGEPIELQPKQKAILRLLVEKQGGLASREKLIDTYWAEEMDKDDAKLDRKDEKDLMSNVHTAIGEIRKHLKPKDGITIKNVQGEGYKLVK